MNEANVACGPRGGNYSMLDKTKAGISIFSGDAAHALRNLAGCKASHPLHPRLTSLRINVSARKLPGRTGFVFFCPEGAATVRGLRGRGPREAAGRGPRAASRRSGGGHPKPAKH